jgi:hypothetical protein
MRHLLIVPLCGFILACAPHAPYVKKTQGIQLHSKTSDLMASYIKESPNSVRLCADRMSDIADTNIVRFGIDLSGEGTNEEAGDRSIALGGRNPAVLITRELLYRACELSNNLNLSKEETLAVYYRFLDASLTIAKVQTSTGTNITLPSNTSISSNSDDSSDSDDFSSWFNNSDSESNKK